MQENLKKIVKNVNFYCLVCLYILLTYHFSINNQLIIEIMSKQSSYLRLFSVFNVFCWIRRYITSQLLIRIRICKTDVTYTVHDLKNNLGCHEICPPQFLIINTVFFSNTFFIQQCRATHEAVNR